jgi:hypothetical protein
MNKADLQKALADASRSAIAFASINVRPAPRQPNSRVQLQEHQDRTAAFNNAHDYEALRQLVTYAR